MNTHIPKGQVVDPITIPLSTQVLSPSLSITPNEWYTSARMAIRQEHRAMEARLRGTREEDFAPWLGLESDEAKLGLVAARACVHHLLLILKELVGEDNANEVRPHQITTHVPDDPVAWRQGFIDLADYRGALLHHRPQPMSPVEHPHYPTHVSSQDATYLLERLSDAVDMVLDLLTRVIESPAKGVQRWAGMQGRRAALIRLKDFRTDTSTPI